MFIVHMIIPVHTGGMRQVKGLDQGHKLVNGRSRIHTLVSPKYLLKIQLKLSYSKEI